MYDTIRGPYPYLKHRPVLSLSRGCLLYRSLFLFMSAAAERINWCLLFIVRRTALVPSTWHTSYFLPGCNIMNLIVGLGKEDRILFSCSKITVSKKVRQNLPSQAHWAPGQMICIVGLRWASVLRTGLSSSLPTEYFIAHSINSKYSYFDT